jgi:hypothetical protein
MEEEDSDEGEKTNALATGDDIAIPPRLGAAMAASRSDVRLIVGSMVGGSHDNQFSVLIELFRQRYCCLPQNSIYILLY